MKKNLIYFFVISLFAGKENSHGIEGNFHTSSTQDSDVEDLRGFGPIYEDSVEKEGSICSDSDVEQNGFVFSAICSDSDDDDHLDYKVSISDSSKHFDAEGLHNNGDKDEVVNHSGADHLALYNNDYLVSRSGSSNYDQNEVANDPKGIDISGNVNDGQGETSNHSDAEDSADLSVILSSSDSSISNVITNDDKGEVSQHSDAEGLHNNGEVANNLKINSDISGSTFLSALKGIEKEEDELRRLIIKEESELIETLLIEVEKVERLFIEVEILIFLKVMYCFILNEANCSIEKESFFLKIGDDGQGYDLGMLELSKVDFCARMFTESFFDDIDVRNIVLFINNRFKENFFYLLNLDNIFPNSHKTGFDELTADFQGDKIFFINKDEESKKYLKISCNNCFFLKNVWKQCLELMMLLDISIV